MDKQNQSVIYRDGDIRAILLLSVAEERAGVVPGSSRGSYDTNPRTVYQINFARECYRSMVFVFFSAEPREMAEIILCHFKGQIKPAG